ncbi:hypothetical protein FUAX_32530 [Fulvitalea axinellae]|uniref:Uncharacterized protein n=1 Tax=Fulvitalea axinellae TaxID=1182444 RepID=A0AAU9CFA0_9BACT|nr:hypothetical protein FUAX_32530 [Fulvitalea axinellae]
MSRKNEFQNIANGLVCSFISRNNDVDGYWGIGKLYSHMLNSGTMRLKIDFVKQKIDPANQEFAFLISKYSEWISRQIKKKRLRPSFFKSAELTLTGYPNEPIARYGNIAPNKVHCKMIITDDRNKKYISEVNTWCREHNPAKESRILRQY